ncbi:F-box domain-containing protein [Mycena venus]|uniref:F-box domain-containing protein n=1 Tax=Mycena venus TaxID=2733690 RepID=A0A8H6Y8I2_9AGAR|nr:F-box domain-containing protein [Mycena venus]
MSRCSECGALSTGSPPTGETFDVSVAPGSRHHALLTSNEPPEESESAFIQSVVSKTDAPLARLDEQISRLRGQLKQLEDKYALVIGYRTRNRAILSPLRRIPPEILREIFSWTVPSIRDALIRGSFDMHQSPWVLTRICSRWREVSISTPSLWSRVAIDYPQSLYNSSTYSFPLLEAQLKRSQKLSIHFYGANELDSSSQTRMFQLLAQHSSRWEELSIGLTSETWPLLSALRDRLPSLTRLWIQWTGPESQSGVNSIDCFQTASSLIDFGVFNQHRFIPIPLPLSQLTRYQLDCSWEQHKRILKETRSLLEARIYIDFDEEDWPDSDETIDVLHLQRLYVSDADSRLMGQDIQRFSHFSVLFSIAPRVPFGGSASFPPAAYPTVEILQNSPSITELVIVNDDNAMAEINTLMAALTVSNLPGSTAVAPHLSLMFFGCDEENYIHYPAYVEMLQSRWKAENCALRTAALLVADGPRPDFATLRDLHTLRQEGLDLLLLNGGEARDAMEFWDYRTRWG